MKNENIFTNLLKANNEGVNNIIKELEELFIKRISFSNEQINKAHNDERVNDDSFLQALAERNLITNIINILKQNGVLPKNLNNPIYKDELTNAFNLFLWLKLGLDKREIFTQVIDADNLRNFNKQRGYAAGDEMLKAAVQIYFSQGKVVFRLYGDYFAIYNRNDFIEILNGEWILE